MKNIVRMSALAVVLALAGVAGSAEAQTLTTRRVMSGLVRPNYVTHAPGDPSRVFVIEKQGRIRIMKDGVLLPTPFLDIDPIVMGGTTTSSEQGLLGLAFHPDYQTNGFFYVNYIAAGGGAAGQTILARYKVSSDPDVADATSAMQLINIPDPFSNHNGGWTVFGPDGYMYFALGDGGSAGDPNNNAQNPTVLFGKMHRIDVNGDDFPADPLRNYAIPPTNPYFGHPTNRPEIWALGLRNHWRNAFDSLTGDLYIADVGQNLVEEINFQPASSKGGENYGWRCYEGLSPFMTAGCGPITDYVSPVHTYTHADGCSLTGGEVYRGCAIPSLAGTYFFADYCSAKIWTFKMVGGVKTAFTERTAELAPGGGLGIASITGFGIDFYGEVYIADQDGGEIFKIIARGFSGPDCDGNGKLDIADFTCFQNKFALGDAYANCNGDLTPAGGPLFDIQDFTCFQNRFALGCP